MHELPKELTNSLRSFRGSVYGRQQPIAQDTIDDNIDPEKERYGDQEFDRALEGTESSSSLVSCRQSHLPTAESCS